MFAEKKKRITDSCSRCLLQSGSGVSAEEVFERLKMVIIPSRSCSRHQNVVCNPTT
ncbi:hypothetical protein DPMN_068943 [Dreissena polymorpha]|uniref:Uncharacterized protein n=1 Tax=Dreissena polymorpha TaxID=45954 RepID=A0A9D3Z2K2_DREPO|nr:hypothetical protein DPMN_068943 [Dreissena polymorpha]